MGSEDIFEEECKGLGEDGGGAVDVDRAAASAGPGE